MSLSYMSIFEDKVVIVTGGASGLGRALCEALAREGATVVAADIDLVGAQTVARSIVSTGGRTEAVLLDVTHSEDVEGLVDHVVRTHGRLDYMFNNAGIGVSGEVKDLPLDDWRKVVDVNLWGVIYGTRAAYSVMLRERRGHIVNIASAAGLVGEPGLTPYSVTKSAVVALSLAVRAEAEQSGVRVSVVCPGFIDTAIFENAIGTKVDKAEFLARLPVRLVAPNEAARRILRGLERNQRIIVFPFYARLAWWLCRLHPSLLDKLHRRTLAQLRAVRKG
jgi:NAD(P)-dependent dehydrogenase (short-subunit alcohol dehydrogenase family)